MRLLAILISLLLLVSCKKENDLSGERVLVADFSYVNPNGKVLSDSIIYLPLSGNIAEINSKFQFYAGAQFVSNTRRENKDRKGYPTFEEVYINWKLKDLASNLIIKDEDTSSLLLSLNHLGKYELTQYVYASSDDRDKSFHPLDSVSKMIIVNDVLSIDSISVERFSFSSPYVNWDINKNRRVDAFVSIYKNKSSMQNEEEPIFETALTKAVNENIVNWKFSIPPNNTIPSIYDKNDEKGNCLIQFNVVQDGKIYTILDNEWGLIFKYLTKGYYSSDKSKLLNEQILRWGEMKLKIWTSYNFMD